MQKVLNENQNIQVLVKLNLKLAQAPNFSLSYFLICDMKQLALVRQGSFWPLDYLISVAN